MITEPMTRIYKANLRYYKGGVYLVLGEYSNGRTALQFLDARNHSQAFAATINLPDVKLTFKEIIIKDYSENVGMLDFLQENKIVGPVRRYVKSGFVNCPVVELLLNDK